MNLPITEDVLQTVAGALREDIGHADVTTAVEMVRAGATEYVEPPALPRRLRSAVRHAIAACKP